LRHPQYLSGLVLLLAGRLWPGAVALLIASCSPSVMCLDGSGPRLGRGPPWFCGEPSFRRTAAD